MAANDKRYQVQFNGIFFNGAETKEEAIELVKHYCGNAGHPLTKPTAAQNGRWTVVDAQTKQSVWVR